MPATFPGPRRAGRSSRTGRQATTPKPCLEDWFAEPLLVRLDLHGRDPHEPGKRIGPSHDAGPYLAYLSLVHGLRLDADYVLSRNFDSLFVPKIAAGLGLDHGNAKLKERLDQSEQTVDELTKFRTQALARLAAQHEEIVHLRGAADASNRVTRLPSPRTTVIGSCS